MKNRLILIAVLAIMKNQPGFLLHAEITVVPERLSIDGFVKTCALFWEGSDSKGWRTTGFEFQRQLAVLGLTAQVVENVDNRLEFDFSQINLRDLYLDFRWENGLALRLGQFKPALNFESETPENDLRFEDYTIMYGNVFKPAEVRDIGLGLSYHPPCPGRVDYRIFGNVLNGSGANSGDNNGWKDLSCRVVVKPFVEKELWLGGSGYYGFVGASAVRWLGLAGEAKLKQKGFLTQGEFIFRRYQNRVTIAGFVEASNDYGFFVPGTRVELISRDDGKLQGRGLATLGLDIFENRLKVLLGYQYHTVVGDWGYQGIIVQLQALL
ncbi:MAG: hypothetical protein ACUVUD_03300 [bacterium]